MSELTSLIRTLGDMQANGPLPLYGTALQTPCLCLFVSPDHDQDLIQSVQDNTAPLCEQARSIPCDLRLYEMADHEVMNDDTRLQAISYGMMAVDETMDCILIGSGDSPAVKANCLNSFMSQASAPQAGLMGAMIATLLADLPCLIQGSAASATLALLDKLVPGLADRVINVDDDEFTDPEQKQAGASRILSVLEQLNAPARKKAAQR